MDIVNYYLYSHMHPLYSLWLSLWRERRHCHTIDVRWNERYTLGQLQHHLHGLCYLMDDDWWNKNKPPLIHPWRTTNHQLSMCLGTIHICPPQWYNIEAFFLLCLIVCLFLLIRLIWCLLLGIIPLPHFSISIGSFSCCCRGVCQCNFLFTPCRCSTMMDVGLPFQSATVLLVDSVVVQEWHIGYRYATHCSVRRRSYRCAIRRSTGCLFVCGIGLLEVDCYPRVVYTIDTRWSLIAGYNDCHWHKYMCIHHNSRW